MSIEKIIAQRIAHGEDKSFSRFIIRIAIIAITLSVTIMICSICMVGGFTREIKEKIFGFWGEIHIHNLDNKSSFEAEPIDVSTININKIKSLSEVKIVSPYITKAGILKSKTEIEGIAVKGIDQHTDWTFINDYIIDGKAINYTDTAFSKDVLISKVLANKLNLKVDDNIIVYFLKKQTTQPIGRKVHISGIYKTGLYEYDEKFVLCDLRLLQQINMWQPNEVTGLEVRLKDMGKMDAIKDKIYYTIIDNTKYAETIKEVYPSIFEWLNLQKTNEYIILLIMAVVALLNMVSALIILILDRTQMIGILKALGASTRKIEKIFIYQASYIIFYGLILGNSLAMILCLIQRYTGIIKLNEENYYLSEVPVYFDIPKILIVNILTFVICFLVLYIPSRIIGRISPIKAIRFD
ncbi:MAG: FtsX-like permease family protein [Chitinophagales bacterium]